MIIIRVQCVNCRVVKDVIEAEGEEQPICDYCFSPTSLISVAIKKTTRPGPSLIKYKR